jgi:hypothetical protein
MQPEFKQQFQQAVSSLGLTEEQYEIAKLVWAKAEKVLMQKPTQEAVLLKPKQELHQEVKFTQQELQSLSSYLSSYLKLVNSVYDFSKSSVSEMWERCDKNSTSEHNELAFSLLNSHKDNLRKIKKRKEAVEKIQRKTKKLLRSKVKSK